MASWPQLRDDLDCLGAPRRVDRSHGNDERGVLQPSSRRGTNPWRDSTGYDRVAGSIADVAAGYGATKVGYIDGFSPFLAVGKASQYYRAGSAGNVHPSDSVDNSAGAQPTCDALMAAFNRSSKIGVSTPNWVRDTSGTNLLPNGNFSNWTGATPVSWPVSGRCTEIKETTIKYTSKFSWSNAIKGVSSASIVSNLPSGSALTPFKGKTLSFAMLVYSPKGADAFSTNFVVRVNGLGLQTIRLKDFFSVKDNWMMYVAAGIPADAVQNDFQTQIRIDPNFNSNSPPPQSQYVQIASVVEGGLPKGFR